MFLILYNTENRAYQFGNWLLAAGVLGASLEETKVWSQQMYLLLNGKDTLWD